MIFKDRHDAGKKLGSLVAEKLQKVEPKNIVVISLLRGGIIIGHEVAKHLHASHLPLVVTKVSAPQSDELAIGAVVFDITYLDPTVIQYIGEVPRPLIRHQIEDAQFVFNEYIERYFLQDVHYKSAIKGKTVVIADDGIATGASVKAAYLFLTTLKPKEIYIAAPVVLGAVNIPGVPIISLVPNGTASAISQFYESFSPVEDNEVLKLLKTS